jgi:tetratricopeptide (TPR) repeat protein
MGSVGTVRLIAVAILLLSSTPAVAHAQKAAETASARRPCFDSQAADPTTQIIDDCTTIIESGSASEYELWSAFQNRGMAYFLSPDPDHARALEDLSRAATLAASPTVLVNRGRAYTAQQNYADAIADFDRAIALEPNFAAAYYRRGIAYAEQSQFVSAIADIDHAVELSPENHAYQNGRCRIRILANVELNVARSACDETIRLSPDPSSGLLLRGMVGIKQEQWQDAWNDFDRLLQAEPNYATALFGRGLAAIGMGRVDEGERDIARATEVRASVVTDFAAFGITP